MPPSTMLNATPEPPQSHREPIPVSDLDRLLTAQILLAWAGEGGEEKRLAWWRSDMTSEYGGEDLFQRLLPNTWRWAVLQAAREAARRVDADLRGKDHDPDRIVSLFRLGFDLDERVEERFHDLKRAGAEPRVALPGLGPLMDEPWSREGFLNWVQGHGESEWVARTAGRHIEGSVPLGVDRLVHGLVGGLAPVSDSYPLPHFRRSK
jgi:hypothetical protein